MACTLKPDEIKRVKALGFLNNKGTDLFNGRVITVNGKITADQMAAIADAARKYGNGEVEFTARLSIEVRGIHFNDIEKFRSHLAEAGLETGGTGALVRPVVSCKGTTCQYGLYDTFALSEKIHERFYKGYHMVKLPHKFKIATGGCPNNCVKPNLNDIGIVGQLIPCAKKDLCRGCRKCQVEIACPMKAAKLSDGLISIDSKKCINCGRCTGKCPFGVTEKGIPGFRVYIGGRWGKKINHGKALSRILRAKRKYCQWLKRPFFCSGSRGRLESGLRIP